MAVSHTVAFLAVLVAVVIALPQHQFFGQVHSAQQQPGNLYAVPASHDSHGFRQLAPVVPVGPVSAPVIALSPSKPVKTFPMEHDLEGSLKPAEVMPNPSDARNPDFSALLNKLSGSTVTHTVTTTFFYATSTVTFTSTVV